MREKEGRKVEERRGGNDREGGEGRGKKMFCWVEIGG